MSVRPPSHAVSVELEVPFHDCDPMAVVWHGRYLKYLEAGRCALLKSRRLDVPDIAGLGYRMYVTDVHCRYTYPLRYGDTVRVTSWFSRKDPLLRVSYAVFNITRERRSARASTQLATTDVAGELLPHTPSAILARLPPGIGESRTSDATGGATA